MTQESHTTADQLREILEAIAKIDIDKELIRSVDLGGANFASSRTLFERIQRYADRLQRLDWDLLPEGQVASVLGDAQQLGNALQKVREFTLEGENPMARRDQMAGQLQNQFDAFRSGTVPVVGFLAWETVNLTEMQGKIDDLLDQARTRTQEVINVAGDDLDAKKQEAEKTLEAIRSASAQVGVGVHSEIFGKAADDEETEAKGWLKASIGVAALTIIASVGLVFGWDVNGDISEASVLQVVLAKAAVLTVGFFITINFFRIYRSHVHLAVANRHRETSLRTFQAFAEATTDEDTKNKVLLEATHAIFGHTSSGLVDGRETGVLELLDGATSLVRRSS